MPATHLAGGIGLPSFSYAPRKSYPHTRSEHGGRESGSWRQRGGTTRLSSHSTRAAEQVWGGIYADGGATLIIRNSTIARNSTTGGTPPPSGSPSGNAAGGGVYVGATVTSTVSSTIVAGNTVDGPGTNTDRDVSGAFTSAGYNLIGTAGGATGFVNGTAEDKVGTDTSPINAARHFKTTAARL